MMFKGVRQKLRKALHRKINLVFLCHRPSVWGSLKSIFDTCLADEDFNITIVAIPNKHALPDIGLAHDEFYISEGAEDFFRDYPCTVINGYNAETKEWLNLRTLKPDYMFIQQPYNVCRPSRYNSKKIAKYCKLCYVHYAANFIGNGIMEETYPRDFVRNLSFIFMQDEHDRRLVTTYLNTFENQSECILTGFPRYDGLEQYHHIDSQSWNLPRSPEVKRIIWTPRWCTNEGNCHFFDYKDFLLEYARNNPGVDFLFRPHPQAFIELNATGELPEAEANAYKKQYEDLPNASIDVQKEYLTTFYSSDIMVTDISSIVADYFLTGKPVIYCHKRDCFNDFSRRLSEGFYWVRNQEELEKTLKMLQSGEDPLREKRQELIRENFYLPPAGAGNTIKDIIKDDFFGKE